MAKKAVSVKFPMCPDLPPEALDWIDAYFGEMLKMAEEGLYVSQAMVRVEASEAHQNQVTYWKNVKSAVKWMRGRFRHRRTERERRTSAS